MLPVQRVHARAVFNLSLFEGYVVIDARPPAAFKESHILSAANFDPTDLGTANMSLVSLCDQIIDQGADRYSPLIIYGDDTTSSSAAIDFLINAIQSASQTDAHSQSDQPLSTNPSVNRVLRNMKSMTKEIWVIENGLVEFQQWFPVLCMPDTYTLATLGPYPACITPNVFLGSRAFSMNEESLRVWGITNVLTHVVSKTHFGLASISQVINGITYLRCNIEDKDHEDMAAYFDAANMFIRECSIRKERVLIQLHGRSRSAGLAAAWLMYSQGWNASLAIQYVLAACDAIDPQLMFRAQLESYHAADRLPPAEPLLALLP